MRLKPRDLNIYYSMIREGVDMRSKFFKDKSKYRRRNKHKENNND